MSLTDGDKAVVREIAYEAAKAIGDSLKDQFATQLRLHQAECPIGKDVVEKLNQWRGAWKVLAVVSAVAGSLLTIGATQLLAHILK